MQTSKEELQLIETNAAADLILEIEAVCNEIMCDLPLYVDEENQIGLFKLRRKMRRNRLEIVEHIKIRNRLPDTE